MQIYTQTCDEEKAYLIADIITNSNFDVFPFIADIESAGDWNKRIWNLLYYFDIGEYGCGTNYEDIPFS